jgi:hypothetical protein
VAEGVSGPYIVTTNGTALYTIDRTLFLTDAEGQRKLKDGVRQFRLSGNEKVAVCIDRAGHVVQLPFAESSDSETVFPESADALHWVNEDGTVVYTQKGEVRIKQLRNETRPIFKDADGYLPVTEDGKFYYWKNEIIKISLAEMVSDRNRVADERMVEPTRPTRPEPPIDRSSTAPTDLVVVPESSETEPTPAGTTPVEETKKDADSLRHPPAAVPMAQLPEPTPGQVGQTTTTAGQSQPTEGESGSSEGESGRRPARRRTRCRNRPPCRKPLPRRLSIRIRCGKNCRRIGTKWMSTWPNWIVMSAVPAWPKNFWNCRFRNFGIMTGSGWPKSIPAWAI